MNNTWQLVNQVRAEIPAHMNLEVLLDEGRVIFRQIDSRSRQDHKSSIIFGCVWAVIVPLTLYSERASFSYLWVVSVGASVWWCYGVFVKGSLPLKEIRYFEIDTAHNQLRVPRPTPYDVETHQTIEISAIERFFVKDLHENAGSLFALVRPQQTAAPVELLLLYDLRYSYDDLNKIGRWLEVLCRR